MGLVFSTACVVACYLHAFKNTEHRRADKNVTSAFSNCYDTSVNQQSINPSSSFRSRHNKFLASKLEGDSCRAKTTAEPLVILISRDCYAHASGHAYKCPFFGIYFMSTVANCPKNFLTVFTEGQLVEQINQDCPQAIATFCFHFTF